MNHYPLTIRRAKAIIAAAPRDPFGAKTDLSCVMTPDEIAAVRQFWRQHMPGSSSFNSTIHFLALDPADMTIVSEAW